MFNSFHNRVQFGTILEGRRNFFWGGGGWTHPHPLGTPLVTDMMKTRTWEWFCLWNLGKALLKIVSFREYGGGGSRQRRSVAWKMPANSSRDDFNIRPIFVIFVPRWLTQAQKQQQDVYGWSQKPIKIPSRCSHEWTKAVITIFIVTPFIL